MAYSRKRQRFLVNQGYAYKVYYSIFSPDFGKFQKVNWMIKVVNEFPDMAKEHLDLATKDEQLKLLSQVLQSSEADAMEEDTKEELIDGIPNRVCFTNFFFFCKSK
jgi:DNA excision repair protein ERCC-3